MNKDMLKNIALILLLGIAAFSMVKYVSELKAKYMLQDRLAQAQGQITVLAQEKQKLLQDMEKEKELKEKLALRNTDLKNYLRAGRQKITRLFQDNAKTQTSLEEQNAELSILKAENNALIDGRKGIYSENEQLKLKLSSIVELKKAIRELKTRKHNDSIIETEGNRGFLIKDGRLTTSEKIKIEVIPAPYKSLRDSTGPAQTKK